MSTEIQLHEEITEENHFNIPGNKKLTVSEITTRFNFESWTHANKINLDVPLSRRSDTSPAAELGDDDSNDSEVDDEAIDDDQKFGNDNKTDWEGNEGGDSDADEDLNGSMDDDSMADPEDFDEEADDDDY